MPQVLSQFQSLTWGGIPSTFTSVGRICGTEMPPIYHQFLVLWAIPLGGLHQGSLPLAQRLRHSLGHPQTISEYSAQVPALLPLQLPAHACPEGRRWWLKYLSPWSQHGDIGWEWAPSFSLISPWLYWTFGERSRGWKTCLSVCLFFSLSAFWIKWKKKKKKTIISIWIKRKWGTPRQKPASV